MTTPNIEDLIYQLECDLYDWNNYVEVDTAPCPLDRYVAPALLNIKQALQSQAECIKALELDLDVQAGSIEAVQAVNARQAERIKALEAAPQVGYFYKWKEAMHGIARLMDERDTLRAQLAEIENVEPVIWAISYDGVTPYTLWHEGDGPLLDCEVERQGGTTQKMPLFTRPMPAQPIIGSQAIHDAITVDPTLADCSQDVNVEIEKVEPVAIALNTGTRQAVKWLQNIPHGEKLYTRPMPVQSAEHCLWARNGHEPCQHVKPMQDVTELVEAVTCLLQLIRREAPQLSGKVMGFAETALSKYKGAK